ncbi:MAG: glycosyltransferase family 2 protein [Myxococcales bacterium]|nr:glycosyltransferase family 2 protein [Myxococcales bacterium]
MSELWSVVIVNWNGLRFMGPCLDALARQTYAPFEIVVVDNGSTDGSLELLRARAGELVLVEAGENLGFAEGCNRGIAHARGNWLCMLNNDTVVDERWLEALVRAAATAPADCGMLQSLQLYFDRPERINSAGIRLRPDGGGSDRGDGEPRDGVREPEPIFSPTAGAAAYRRSMLEHVRLDTGYFDRRHFLYFEDMDLGWRAQLSGFTARTVPDSIVYHHYHGSTDRVSSDALAAMVIINRWRTLAKNASFRFFATASLRGAWRLWPLWRHGGTPALRRLGAALGESLASRRRVSELCTRDRRAIERRWVDR